MDYQVDEQDLLALLLEEEGIVFTEAETIPRRGATEPTLLSFAQQRLWILQQMEPQNPAYNIPLALRLCGQLDQHALGESFNEILRRHEVLRTRFVALDGRATADILPTLRLSLPVDDLRHLPPAEQEQQLHQQLAAEAMTPFDLAQAPLLRLRLLQLSDNEHVLLLNMHHIIADGWSMGVWVGELSALYQAFALGQPSPLPELEIQYADFSAWQQSELQGERLAQQLGYWRDQLHDLPVLELPGDRPRPPQMGYAGATQTFTLPADVTQALKRLGQDEDATLFMVLLAAFQVLLYRYSGQADFAIGIPAANRSRRELEPLIGFFVNSLAIRSQVDGQPSFRAVLRHVRDSLLAAYEQQDIPFDRLVQELLPSRDLRFHPFFQVMFSLEAAAERSLHLPGLRLQSIDFEPAIAKFDLTLVMQETSDGLAGGLNYNCDLFDHERIERMVGHLQTLLAAIVATPDQAIDHLPILSAAERRQLLQTWNDTATPYPAERTIIELFEAQVARTPQAIALEFGDQQLTYGELNQRANRLGWRLRQWGVTPNMAIGLCVEQSLEMVVGMLAILKAGGGYAPLNPSFPPERLAFMLEDTQVSVVLTQSQLVERLPNAGVRLLCLDCEDGQGESSENLPAVNQPGDLAYVIYTSGSTGQPKGIAIPQRAVNRLLFATNYVSLSAQDRIGQASNFAFDAITFELWGALLHGGCLVQVDRETMLSPQALALHLSEKRINTLFLTTALFNQVARSEPTAFAPLRYLLFGGEAVEPRWVAEVLEKGAPAHLLHVYGPTETTTFATFYEVCHVAGDATTVPIGRPIANTTAYVLDKALQPVPIGVPGELYLGGDGLAIGYLARPALNEQKFVADPFSSRAGDRLYRTGDWVRMAADGAIEFLGRIDNQVKIRGFRIEPDEINAIIGQHEAVAQSVVIVQEHASGRRLIAYVACKAEAALERGELRAFLLKKLPDYMVPAHFVFLPELPINHNGKVDRHALPDPDESGQGEDESKFSAPTDPAEVAVAAAWQSVLGLARVDIHDNYFELGGDSIKAIQVVSQLRRAGWLVDVPKVFLYPTIAELARQLQAEETNVQDQSAVQGAVPLTAIQRWFFAEPATDRNHFNQAVLLRSDERLDEQALAVVFGALQRHHDALRMTYGWEDGVLQQVNAGVEMAVDFTMVELVGEPDPAAALQAHVEAAQRGFNLQTGPLLKAVLYRCGDGDRLQIVIHHLVVDGVSWRILLEDLAIGYRQAQAGQAVQFAPKSASFQQWANAVAAYAQSEAIQPARAYWQDVGQAIAGAEHNLLAVSEGDSAVTYGESTTVAMQLSEAETRALLSETHHAYTTEINDLLLSALARALQQWSGCSQSLIALEGHGRQPLPESSHNSATDSAHNSLDISRTVGWFTSLFPFLLTVEGGEIGEQIVQVKEALRRIPNKGLEYGILRYVGGQASHASPAWPVKPQISFNFLGEIDAARATGLFTFAEESSGTAISPNRRRDYLLDLVGVVSGGRLLFSISFAPGQVAQARAEALLEHFRTELLTVTEHCRNKTEGEKTLSDFGDVDLSEDEFANILDILGS